MRIIGLTGQTGSGKSTVGAHLQAKGCGVIDCDILARQVTLPGAPALKELAEEFGGDILTPDGSLNRALLAQRAFSSPAQQAKLNAITHPAVIALVKEALTAMEAQGKEIAVIDAPLLFESGLDSLCHKTVFVEAPLPLRLTRIMARDGISKEAALLRINAQPPDTYYKDRADIVITNGSDDSLAPQIEGLLQGLSEKL